MTGPLGFFSSTKICCYGVRKLQSVQEARHDTNIMLQKSLCFVYNTMRQQQLDKMIDGRNVINTPTRCECSGQLPATLY